MTPSTSSRQAARTGGDSRSPSRAIPLSRSATQVRRAEPAIPAAHEVQRSRKAALLQLKMGRSAQVFGLIAAGVLAALAVLVYSLNRLPELEASLPFDRVITEWSLPLFAGLGIALAALYLKWQPYVADRDEPHFLLSLAAVGVSAGLIALLFARQFGYLSFEETSLAGKLLFPGSLLGIALSQISLAMTWQGWSRRKTAAVAAAAAPPLLLFFTFFVAEEDLPELLAIAYLGSALMVHISGSTLHLIASSTSEHEREILKASDSKLASMTKELQSRAEVLTYQEGALRVREAELEAFEAKLENERLTIEGRRTEVAALQADMEKRAGELREGQRELARQRAELEAHEEARKVRSQEIDTRASQTDRATKDISAREAAILEREKEVKRFSIDLGAKERDLSARARELAQDQERLKTFETELEALQGELARRDADLRVREDATKLRAQAVQTEALRVGKEGERVVALQRREQALLAQQEQLAQRELALKETEDTLSDRKSEAERMEQRAQSRLTELKKAEEQVTTREKALSDSEETFKEKIREVERQLKLLDDSKSTLSEREHQYSQLVSETRTRATTLATSQQEFQQRASTIETREAKLKELEAKVAAQQEEMNARFRELLEKRKEVEDRMAELSLREVGLQEKEREVLVAVEGAQAAQAEAFAGTGEDRTKVFALQEKRLREKEQEMKTRLYQREKELERREAALRDYLKKGIEEGQAELIEEVVSEEKVKTGTPRLDDFLLGGIPFGANVLFIGPPFVGKEVAMYAFVAEGLKRGVPSLIITTTKPPSEIAREIAPVLPTFLDFEKLGLVKWIDATGSQETVEDLHIVASDVLKAKGPTDYDGILAAHEQVVDIFAQKGYPYYRVVYLSLSLSVTQTDEKAAYRFVQTFVGRLKQTNGIAFYAIERGMHSDQQLETLGHQMTGAIHFKTDKQKTLLMVQGVTDVQTRDWIDYRFTNKGLILGAFALERIR